MGHGEQNHEEYSSLRDELDRLSTRRFTTATFAVTATAALLGFAFQSSEHQSLIMLTPLLILGFAGVQLVSQAFSTLRIVTYIRRFIEPQTDSLNWETSMHKYRVKVPEYAKLRSLSWPSYQGMVLALGWVCVILAGTFAGGDTLSFVLTIVSGLLWLLFSVWLVIRMNQLSSGAVETALDDLWERIAENDAAPNTTR